MTVRLRSWSFSTYQQLQRCPRRVKLAKIDKLPDPVGPAADRGTAIHAAFEGYARGELHALPAGFETWRPMLDHILETADDVMPELQVSMTRRWRLTTWEEGIVRAKLDLVAAFADDSILCVDYKTGRVYPEHERQLELYAALLFQAYPWAVRIRTADWYLDQDDHVVEKTFEASEADGLKAVWKRRIGLDLKRRTFPPRRNAMCKYCAFNSKRGGPCVEGA